MQLRHVGRTSLSVAPLVLGGTVFGWTVDQASAFRILDAFVDAGFNAIDTADSYSRAGPGSKGRTDDSEAIIGNWLSARPGRRSRVLIFTKVGREMGPGKKGLSWRHIMASVEESLRRLQTDVIDLYQSHRDDATTSLEETLEAYGKLISDGKVRFIGASNFKADRLRESLAVACESSLPRYECLQPRFNLYERDYYDSDMEQLCLSENIGVLAYYALAGGFLTGKYRSLADCGATPRGARMPHFLTPKGQRVLEALDEVALPREVAPAAVALAWPIARHSVTAAIASITRTDHLTAFSSAVDMRLSTEELGVLDGAGADPPAACH